MRFARTLRMNFQQIGDAKAVNKAILLELDATANSLRKSWLSSESYYREKYAGWKKLRQFIRWAEFRMPDAIWGNGERTLKLLRTLMVVHVLIAIYDTAQFRDPWSLRDYLDSLVSSPGRPRHMLRWKATTPSFKTCLRSRGTSWSGARIAQRFICPACF